MNQQQTTYNWEKLAEQSPRELVLSGADISKQIENEGGINELVYLIKSLNFVEITRTSSLKDISPKISNLSNLTNLVLHSNQLTKIPDEIGSLAKLKFLDLSRNLLTELPSSIANLSNLQSFNVELNKLEQLCDLSKLSNLLVIKFGYNSLTQFPESLCNSDANLTHLSEIHGQNNKITDIPMTISKLVALKILDLNGNEINVVPGQLGDCHKLKDLNLKGNKVKDRRLMKLIDQCHVKQIMDYIRSNCPRNTGTNNEKNDKQNNRERKPQSRESSQDRKAKAKEARQRHRSSSRNSSRNEELQLPTIEILPVKDDNWFKVVATPGVLDMRKVVACIIRNADLTAEGSVKKFLTLQTNLHNGICGHRQHATIATHDLAKIIGNSITFDVRPPGKLRLIPLNRNKEMSASELYKVLNEEAEAYRKEKKRQTYSGIHKYLYLLKGKNRFPCVYDDQNVISFPPITNSETTKISSETKNLLIEVTGESVPTCKKVMDALLHATLKLGLAKAQNSSAELKKESENNNSEKSIPQVNILQVEPVRVYDTLGKMLIQYPSRVDLIFEDINVTRNKD